MANLGTLTLDLVAKIGKFTEPLDQAERKAKKSTKNIADGFDVASLAAKAFGAVVAGASISAIDSFVTRTIDAGNEITRFSKLANASVQQFQYYATGAQTAGISIEKFADQMKDMQDRIGDFQQTGGGPLADFFKNIAPLAGVTIQQFQKLSGPDALQLFYNSIVKVGGTKNDIKFYMEQIISDSSLLIPLLENGGAGFKKWGDAAKNSGAIMSESVVKDLTKIKENIQLQELKWQGLKNSLVEDVVPAIKTVSDNFDTVKAVAVALGAVLATRLAFQLGAVTFQFAIGVAQGIAYEATLMGLQGQSLRTATAMGVLKAISGALGGPLGIGMLVAQGAVAYTTFQYMKKGSDELKPTLIDQKKSIEDLIKSYSTLNEEGRQFEKGKLREKIEEDQKAVKKSAGEYFNLATAMRNTWSTEQIEAYNKLFEDVTKNGVDTNKAFTTIQATGLFSQKELDQIAKYNNGYSDSNKTLIEHKDILSKLENKEREIAKAHEATTKAVNNQAAAYLKLTEKQREALKAIDLNLARNNYIQTNMNLGWSREKAEYVADYRNSAGLGYTGKALSPLELEKVIADFNSKNYELSSNDRKKIAGAVAFVTANSLENVAKSKGIPANLITGLIAQESGGKNLTSPTGAKGEFQTTSIFREDNASTLKKGGYSHVAYTEAASNALLKGFKEFGNWTDALMAYNGGVAGTKALKAGRISDQVTAKGGSQKINGQLYLSPAKAKEMTNYPKQVLKYQAGAGGSTTIDQSMSMPTSEDLLKWQNEAIQTSQAVQDAKDTFEKQLSTPLKQMELENSKTVKKLQETYADDPKKLKEMLDKNNVLYQANRNQLIADRKNEYDQYFSFEKDRVTQISESYDFEISKIKENTKYTKAERQKISDSLERQKQSEIEAIKREEQQQVQTAFEVYLTETDIVLNRYKTERDEILRTYEFAKDQSQLHTKDLLLQANQMAVGAVLDKNRQKIDDKQYQSLDYLYRKQHPNQAAWTDLQNQYDGAQGALSKDYSEQRGGIFSAVDDETNRNQQLLAAHEQYLQAKAALNEEYAVKETELRSSLVDSQLNQLGSLVGNVSSSWSSITDIVKNQAGEQSAVYQAMFAVQQAFAITSATINAFQAYGQIMASPWYLDIISKETAANLALGMGMANVGMIAAQALTGMAHDGISNVPEEGTWLLKKGERVLNDKDNKAFTNLMNQGSTGGDVHISVQVTDSGVSTQSNQADQKQLGQMIGNAVRAVIMQEKRQGGLLSK